MVRSSPPPETSPSACSEKSRRQPGKGMDFLSRFVRFQEAPDCAMRHPLERFLSEVGDAPFLRFHHRGRPCCDTRRKDGHGGETEEMAHLPPRIETSQEDDASHSRALPETVQTARGSPYLCRVDDGSSPSKLRETSRGEANCGPC